MSATFEKWEPIDGIETPCADVEFEFRQIRRLTVRMRFSQALKSPRRDLLIEFDGLVAMRYEIEEHGIDTVDGDIPYSVDCDGVRFAYPLLRVRGSSWFARHTSDMGDRGDRGHFLLITYNDIVELIADSEPAVSWCDPRS